jgi:Holliday junction resolvase
MGKAEREKGKRYERDIASRYREVFGESVRRGNQAIANVEPDIVGAWLFSPECKHVRSISVWEAMHQAERGARYGTYPVLHIKRHGGDEITVLVTDDFFEIAKMIKDAEK